mmetsp:Transcript_114005/g.329328  ORF Transcript_114005/g.329328 Transcript_114005/m.329328 type:complete len:214 (-) Transcript_114005:438-1079(-)
MLEVELVRLGAHSVDLVGRRNDGGPVRRNFGPLARARPAALAVRCPDATLAGHEVASELAHHLAVDLGLHGRPAVELPLHRLLYVHLRGPRAVRRVRASPAGQGHRCRCGGGVALVVGGLVQVHRDVVHVNLWRLRLGRCRQTLGRDEHGIRVAVLVLHVLHVLRRAECRDRRVCRHSATDCCQRPGNRCQVCRVTNGGLHPQDQGFLQTSRR